MRDFNDIQEPLVSVIVPVFNCEKYLKRCLESLSAQTLPNIEFILVNNGSTDGSGEILREYAEQDRRFTLIEQDNQGIQGSRNRGLKAANGEYVGFVDADDFVDPAMFCILLKRAVSTGSDISICDYVMTFREHETKSVLGLSDEVVDTAALNQETFYLRYFGRNPVVWNKLYRKALLTEHGIQFEVGHGEDLLLHLRLLPHIKQLCVSHQPLYHYVQRRASAAHSLAEVASKDVTLLSKYLENAVDSYISDRISMLAFSNIFTGFMFSAYCIGKPIRYFYTQIQIFSQWKGFYAFCRVISQTNELDLLYQERVMSKRFHRFQKYLFGLCLHGHDRKAAVVLWAVSKLIILKKRRFQIGQFE